ncbi:MAG: SDR family oxidoreductase [Spirochaetales bacterium]|nr:SDR family oxidoreductase [Leptospiraceae bacterium]MCP5482711.1 SDR family oxidoreductase [Spirochaetales bacterium]MCP5485097.1 SDR family oxidoreductase [Spirochaetales bacterium]
MANVIVTGANRGIGLEFCRQFLERGDHVIAACRKPSSDLEMLGAKGNLQIEGNIDVASDNGASMFAERLGNQPIEILVNNAGIMRPESLEKLDIDSIRQQFEVNSLGPLRVTRALLPNLEAGARSGLARVAIITSRMGSIADNTSGGMYGYRMSKAAVNMAGVSLAHDLKSRKVAVAILHPGYVKTDMTNHGGQIEPSEAVRGLIARIDALTLKNTGTFWHQNGEVLPW